MLIIEGYAKAMGEYYCSNLAKSAVVFFSEAISERIVCFYTHFLNCLPYVYSDTKKASQVINLQGLRHFKSGPDGTRTRDLRRDRAAF